MSPYKVTFENEYCAVIDDFLPKDHHELMWNYIQSEHLEYVQQSKWQKAFRLTDGNPLRSRPYLSDPYEPDQTNPVYPTGKGIDILFEALQELAPHYTNLLGEKGTDWACFFARVYLYQMNSGLSWHRDNENNVTGAFSYYAHPKWHPMWGGELMIATPDTKGLTFPKKKLYNEDDRYLGSHLDHDYEANALLEQGRGVYIMPKPNRCVLLTSGILHTIKKVDVSAGYNVRATLQGFFHDPAGVLKK